MKITKVTLQSFRAFDEPFELNITGGKNLLLYGENGSGKSSLHIPLKRFFEERGGSISTHRNLFSPESRTSEVTLHIQGQDATGLSHDRAFVWNDSGHPLAVPRDPPPHPDCRVEKPSQLPPFPEVFPHVTPLRTYHTPSCPPWYQAHDLSNGKDTSSFDRLHHEDFGPTSL